MMQQHEFGWERYLVAAVTLALVLAGVAAAVVLPIVPRRWRER